MMEVFECQKTQSNRYRRSAFSLHCPACLFCRYKLSLLKCTTKALNQSVKISIRVDNRGFLSLQYMILTEDKQVCFVEYMVG